MKEIKPIPDSALPFRNRECPQYSECFDRHAFGCATKMNCKGCDGKPKLVTANNRWMAGAGKMEVECVICGKTFITNRSRPGKVCPGVKGKGQGKKNRSACYLEQQRRMRREVYRREKEALSR